MNYSPTPTPSDWFRQRFIRAFHGTPHVPVNWISVLLAAAVTIYFWWQNTKGIHESSEKALRIMQITTVMVVILLGLVPASLC